MERVFYIENCLVCAAQLINGKNEITTQTTFSQKAIYTFIEEFTNTYFSEEIINEAGVCINCLRKFNQYDEHNSIALNTKQELISLFEESCSSNAGFEEEPHIKEEEENIEAFIEDVEVEGHSMQHEDVLHEDEESKFNEEFIEMADENNPEVMDLIEVGFLDTDKLPRKFQSPEERQKLMKAKTVKVKSDDDGLTIVQISNLKLFQCNICQRTFKEKSKLKSHMQIHTTERNIFCPDCGKSFKTAACLRSHKRVHNPTIIECDYCGKTYTQKPELIKHINFVHFNRRDFVCDVCNAGFGCKGHLKAHQLTHQEYKGVSCEVCGFTFHTQAKLQRHMRSHTGQRDYECGICHKRFLYSYNVSAHIKHVHFKEKRKYDESARTCKLCDRKFQKVWMLREHMRDVHQVMVEDTPAGSVLDFEFVET